MKLLFFFLLGSQILQAQAQSWLHKELLAASLAAQDGNEAQAENLYKEIIYSDSTSSQAQYNLGNLLYKKGQYKEAAEAYEKALRYAPNDAHKSLAYNNLGNAQYQEKNYTQAAESYKSALRLSPNDRTVKENLTRALRHMPPPSESQQQQQQQQQQEKQEKEQKEQKQLESVMNVSENEDKKVQEKLKQQMQMPREPSDKDW